MTILWMSIEFRDAWNNKRDWRLHNIAEISPRLKSHIQWRSWPMCWPKACLQMLPPPTGSIITANTRWHHHNYRCEQCTGGYSSSPVVVVLTKEQAGSPQSSLENLWCLSVHLLLHYFSFLGCHTEGACCNPPSTPHPSPPSPSHYQSFTKSLWGLPSSSFFLNGGTSG